MAIKLNLDSFSIGKMRNESAIQKKVRNVLAFVKKYAAEHGLIAYYDKRDLTIDKMGKSTRPAVQGETILGDGNTYIDTTIVPNQSTALRIWGNFNNLSTPSVNQRHGSRTGFETDSFAMGIDSGGTWYAEYGDNAIFGGAEDTNKHKWELYDGEYFVDDVKIGGTKGAIIGNPTNSIYLNATNNNGTTLFPANFNLDRCEIDHNGITYTLNTKPDGSEYQLVPSDGGTPIVCQQYLQPATPTETNITQTSMHDDYGYTVAPGNAVHQDPDLLTGEGWSFPLGVKTHGPDGVIFAFNNRWDNFVQHLKLIHAHKYYFSFIGKANAQVSATVSHLNSPWTKFLGEDITISSTLVKHCYTGVVENRENAACCIRFQRVAEAEATITVGKVRVFDLTVLNEWIDGYDLLSMTDGELEAIEALMEQAQLFYDQAGLLPISQGHPIPNRPDGVTPTAYVVTDKHIMPQEIIGDGNTWIYSDSKTLLAEQNFDIRIKAIKNADNFETVFSQSLVGSSDYDLAFKFRKVSEIREFFVIFNTDNSVDAYDLPQADIGSLYDLHATLTDNVLIVTVNGIEVVNVTRTKQRRVVNNGVNIFRDNVGEFSTSELLQLNINDYTLNTKPDGSEYQLVPSDGSESIVCQQYLQPEIATRDNTEAEDMLNKYGYTVSRALGKNHNDGELITDPLVGGTRVISKNFLIANPNTEYILTNDKSYWNFIIFYDVDEVAITTVNDGGQGKLTAISPNGTKFIKIRSAGGQIPPQSDLNVKYMLSETTESQYEPYKGYTYDQAGLIPISQGHLIPNYPDGTSTAYVVTDKHIMPQEIIGDSDTYIDCGNHYSADNTFKGFNVKLYIPLPTRNEQVIGQELVFKIQSRPTAFNVLLTNGSDGWGHYVDLFSVINHNSVNTIAFSVETGDLIVNGVKFGSYPVPSGYFNSNIFYMLKRDPAYEPFSGGILGYSDYNYKLNTIPNESEYQLVPDDGSESIMCQQYLQPEIPTRDNVEAEDMLNKYGYTVSKALGDNLFDNNSGAVLENKAFNTIGGISTNIGTFADEIFYTYTSQVVISTLLSQSKQIVFYESKDESGYISRINYSGDVFVPPVPPNTKYYRVGGSLSSLDSYQLELGTTPTAYEPYKGYTYDQAGLLPISQGHLIPNLPNGLSSAYVDGIHPVGEFQREDIVFRALPQYQPEDIRRRPMVEYSGRVKYDRRVVDGVVDNGVNYEKWKELSDTSGVLLSNEGIKLVGGSGAFVDARIDSSQIKPSTTYTVVINVLETSISKVGLAAIRNTEFCEELISIKGDVVGEYRRLFTTLPIISNPIWSYIGSTEPGSIKYNFAIYEGDYVTGSPELPPTGEWVENNSFMMADKYNDIIKSDTENILYDAEGNPKVVPIQSNVGNKVLSSPNNNKTMLFRKPLTDATALAKVNKYL